MKLRKIISVAALSGALLLGGATAANAYPDPAPLPSGPATSTVPRTPFHLTPVVLHALHLAPPTHVWNGTGDSRHHIDLPLADFQTLTLNGTVVPRSSYTLEDGSTVVTILNHHLKGLPSGTHTYLAHFDHAPLGGHVTVPLTVQVGGSAAHTSRLNLSTTGPATLLYGVGGLLLVGSGLTVAGSAKRRKAEIV